MHVKNENNKKPAYVEMFIETHQGNKGKELDSETQNAISQLQSLTQNSEETNIDVFQVVLRKEKLGRVSFYGRSITPTALKIAEEIEAIKKEHDEELAALMEQVEQCVSGLENLVKACYNKEIQD